MALIQQCFLRQKNFYPQVVPSEQYFWGHTDGRRRGEKRKKKALLEAAVLHPVEMLWLEICMKSIVERRNCVPPEKGKVMLSGRVE